MLALFVNTRSVQRCLSLPNRTLLHPFPKCPPSFQNRLFSPRTRSLLLKPIPIPNRTLFTSFTHRCDSKAPKELPSQPIAPPKSLSLNRFTKPFTRLISYGGTYIFFHELLGISSYVIVFSLLYSGALPIASAFEYFGITEEILLSRGIDLNSKYVPWAATVVVVKALDLMGLYVVRNLMALGLSALIGKFTEPWIVAGATRVKRHWNRLRNKSETTGKDQMNSQG